LDYKKIVLYQKKFKRQNSGHSTGSKKKDGGWISNILSTFGYNENHKDGSSTDRSVGSSNNANYYPTTGSSSSNSGGKSNSFWSKNRNSTGSGELNDKRVKYYENSGTSQNPQQNHHPSSSSSSNPHPLALAAQNPGEGSMLSFGSVGSDSIPLSIQHRHSAASNASSGLSFQPFPRKQLSGGSSGSTAAANNSAGKHNNNNDGKKYQNKTDENSATALNQVGQFFSGIVSNLVAEFSDDENDDENDSGSKVSFRSAKNSSKSSSKNMDSRSGSKRIKKQDSDTQDDFMRGESSNSAENNSAAQKNSGSKKQKKTAKNSNQPTPTGAANFPPGMMKAMSMPVATAGNNLAQQNNNSNNVSSLTNRIDQMAVATNQPSWDTSNFLVARFERDKNQFFWSKN